MQPIRPLQPDHAACQQDRIRRSFHPVSPTWWPVLDADEWPVLARRMTRWEVETNLRHLKQTLGMDVLRTKSLDGIHKELAMFAIVYNLVRLAMLEAAQRRQIDPGRVSFVDALRWLRCAGQGGSLRPIRVVPERLGRHAPRVKKRRAKNYRLTRKPRPDLMQLLAAQAFIALTLCHSCQPPKLGSVASSPNLVADTNGTEPNSSVGGNAERHRLYAVASQATLPL